VTGQHYREVGELRGRCGQRGNGDTDSIGMVDYGVLPEGGLGFIESGSVIESHLGVSTSGSITGEKKLSVLGSGELQLREIVRT